MYLIYYSYKYTATVAIGSGQGRAYEVSQTKHLKRPQLLGVRSITNEAPKTATIRKSMARQTPRMGVRSITKEAPKTYSPAKTRNPGYIRIYIYEPSTRPQLLFGWLSFI